MSTKERIKVEYGGIFEHAVLCQGCKQVLLFCKEAVRESYDNDTLLAVVDCLCGYTQELTGDAW